MNSDQIVAVRASKTVYRDGDRCVKVFNSNYTKADVLNEALNQARIEETGLNIPEILEVAKIDGKWYYFKEEGVMARSESINGDEVDENGVWIQ